MPSTDKHRQSVGAALALLLSATACDRAQIPATDGPKVKVAFTTSLPLIWGAGGADVGAILRNESKPAVPYQWLSAHYAVSPIDDYGELSRIKPDVAVLAHPGALAPQQLVALDQWIRDGGHAVILADALSTWEGPYPLGDRRNPPITTLLTPLLDHWGITLELNAKTGAVHAAGEGHGGDSAVMAMMTLPDGKKFLMPSPGEFTRYPDTCTPWAQVAKATKPTAILCRVGEGRALILSDADWLQDALWSSETKSNSLFDPTYRQGEAALRAMIAAVTQR